MPRGGKREGAGRKKGSKNKASKAREALAAKASAEGVMPLDVMLQVMRSLFRAKKYGAAAAIAKDVAPYFHAKLASVTVKGNPEQPVRLVEEIVIVHAGGQAPAAVAP